MTFCFCRIIIINILIHITHIIDILIVKYVIYYILEILKKTCLYNSQYTIAQFIIRLEVLKNKHILRIYTMTGMM